MSDKTVATPQEIAKDPALARVPRREALKGLGALAVSTTALAAVGCSADAMGATEDGVASSGASGAPVSTPSTSTTSASSTTTGASQAKPAMTAATAPGMSTPSSSGTPTSSAAAGSGAAPTTGAAMSQPSTAMAAAGSPATGGMSPGASAAGSMSTSSTTGSAGAGASMSGMPGMSGASGAMDLSQLACILSPAQDEGPFFIEEKLNRSDLLMGESDENIAKAIPFLLTIGVYKVNGTMCEPAPGLQVDIWHANAIGVYSDVSPGFVQSTDTKGKQFLRGYQVTGETGVVQFSTIYPGWYPSRTIHIHFKIRMPMGNNSAYDFTSQMYFDETISKEVLSMGPYAKTPGTRMVFNDDDHIFNGTMMNGQKPASGKKPPGMDTMLTIAKMGSGYTGTLKVGLKI